MEISRIVMLLTTAGVLCTAVAEELDLTTPPVQKNITVETLVNESEREIKTRRITRIALGTLTGAFVGLGYYFNSESNDYYNDYLAMPEGDARDAKYEEVQKAERTRNLFYSLGAGTAIGFSFTFMF